MILIKYNNIFQNNNNKCIIIIINEHVIKFYAMSWNVFHGGI